MKITPVAILHVIAGITAAASGLLEVADRITPIAAVDPRAAHVWPLVLAAAIGINSMGSAVTKLFPQPPSVSPPVVIGQTSVLTKP